MRKKITSRMEDYLETIKKIEEEKKVIRVKWIAHRLNVKMSSVTEALKNLSNEGLVKHERYGYIELTKRGSKLAQQIDARHQVLFSFLAEVLGVNSQLANEDACKMEHVMSEVAMNKLIKFVHFFKKSLKEDKLMENFRDCLNESLQKKEIS